MSTIRSSIELRDNFTAVLNNIVNAVNLSLSAMNDLNQSLNAPIDTTSIQAARDSINQAAIASQQLVNAMESAERPIQDNANGQERFNGLLQAGSGLAKQLHNVISGIFGKNAGLKGVQKLVEMSDSLVTSKSRLDMMNDGLQTTDELYNMIYQSAQRARSSLDGMTDVVARFGNNAKDAFSSNEEVVAFSELVQKQMTIAGASTQESANAMLQLSQALGSGVLRGDELNSIFKQAPNMIQGIADYLNVPIGKIREMASEGQLTADVVKASVFASADKINKQFEKMPKTWEQIWQSMQNQAIVALKPLLEKINEIFNDERFQAGLSSIMDAFAALGGVALDVLTLIADVAAWVADNWSVIGPIVMTAAAALGIYAGVLAGVKVVALLANAAQKLFDGSLFACPIFWIVGGLIAFVAIMGVVTKSVNDAYGLSLSFGGMLGGSLMVILAALGNMFIAIGKTFMGVWESMYAIGGNIFTFFYNMGVDIGAFCANFISSFLDVIAGICEALNNLPFINFDYSGITNTANEYAKNAANASERKQEYTDVGAAWERGWNSIDFINPEEAWKAGYYLGDKVGKTFDYNNDINAALNSNYDYEGIKSNIGDISDNTDSIKDSLEITEEDLKYLRDIAEQEAINRFTTAEIHIEQTNNNNVSGEMDLDGVVEGLTSAVNEAVDIITEGVHA